MTEQLPEELPEELPVLIFGYDDLRKVVLLSDGAERPYTPEELTSRAEQLELTRIKTAVKAVIEELNTHMTTVQTVIDTPNTTLNAGPAPYIKDIARAVKRCLSSVKDLARLV